MTEAKNTDGEREHGNSDMEARDGLQGLVLQGCTPGDFTGGLERACLGDGRLRRETKVAQVEEEGRNTWGRREKRSLGDCKGHAADIVAGIRGIHGRCEHIGCDPAVSNSKEAARNPKKDTIEGILCGVQKT